MNLTPYRLMKVIVINLSILIDIEFVKDKFELLLSKVETPVSQVEPEFILCNGGISFLINVTESFSDSLPLEFYLINNSLFKCLIHKLL